MKRRSLAAVLALMLACSLVLSACGEKQSPEAPAADTTAAAAPAAPIALGISDWSMSATTWSSPNGATIHLSATPEVYAEGLIAAFSVRLDGEEVASVPCDWDGTVFTASADLNAADGYSYYVVLTGPDGSTEEFGVNTASTPAIEAYVNMQTALASYCSVTVEESAFAEGTLVLLSGKVQVQAPTITNDGEAITCKSTQLVLSLEGEELGRKDITPEQGETAGLFEAELKDVVFEIPQLESEQKLELYLHVTFSNDQVLSAFGGNWFSSEDGLLPVVG